MIAADGQIGDSPIDSAKAASAPRLFTPATLTLASAVGGELRLHSAAAVADDASAILMRHRSRRLIRPLTLERHPLGPRVYVLGFRVHEVALGLVLIAAVTAACGLDLLELGGRALAFSSLGAWLIIKDWRDLVPAQRNTARWSLLPHRPPHDRR